MTELYEWPPTRSQRVKWVLEELGIDYESRPVNLADGAQDSADYRRLQPLGRVPALRTPGYDMFESVAIVLQLIDENPGKNLAPEPGTAARAPYYQWCIFAGTEMDPPIMMYFDNSLRPLDHMHPPGTPHDSSRAAQGKREFAARADILSSVVADRDFLVDGRFTGADILIGHSCFMATVTGLITDYPQLQSYYRKLQKRPAFQRAYNGFI